MAFEIGDKVIYPNHGLGVIERIETKTIMGTTCGFYQLRMANETTVFVPVDNVEGVGLRRAISDAEVERLFTLLADGNIDSHQNWKGRFKDNSDRMRTGSIYDVVEVLKSLAFLARSKSLSFREKRMLDRAKFLVVSEITEVLSMSTEEVERRVDEALEKCFALKAELDARPRPAAAAKAPEEPAVAAVEPEPAPAPAVRSAAAKTARTAAKTTKVAAKAKPAAAKRTAKAATTRSKASAARKTGGKATTTRRAARAS